MSDPVPPTRHLRPHVAHYDEADQKGNPKPHDYREGGGVVRGVFCIACCLMRPQDGSLDKKPCKGPARISLRGA